MNQKNDMRLDEQRVGRIAFAVYCGVVIALTVGYLGINTIVNGVKGLFEKKEHRKDRK